MTDEERRFKVLKVEKYEKELSQEKILAIVSTVGLGCMALSSVMAYTIEGMSVLGYLSLGVTTYNLHTMISSISKKTLLESKIDDINFELENEEKEEQRGKSL